MEEITNQFQGVKLEDSKIEEVAKVERPNLEEVEKILEYTFENKSLLEEAYTHPRYQRLEYIGDSVLNFVISTQQFNMYPDLSPGQLTELRAANVSTEKLARAAVKHGLYKFLRHEIPRPTLDARIEEFIKTESTYPLHYVGVIDAPKGLADIVESTIGAVYVDSKSCVETTSKVINKLLQPMITSLNLAKHPVTLLLQICQRNGFKVEVDDRWKNNGEIEVSVAGEFVGKGECSTKRVIAYNRAAANVYSDIVKKLIQNDIVV